MNQELLTPGVPALSDEWIAQRTQHLLDEIATPSPRKRRRSILSGVGGAAIATSAALVGLLGPWASPAFAGWSAQPTPATTSQLTTAEATCATLATNLAGLPGSTASGTLPPMSLTDARGPYTLIVYGTTNPALCVAGNGLTSLQENGGTTSIGSATIKLSPRSTSVRSGSTNVIPTPNSNFTDGATIDLSYTSNDNGQSFSVVEGTVGAQATGATLTLSDGTSLVATVSNGLFAAWWPGQATVSSIQVTTTTANN